MGFLTDIIENIKEVGNYSPNSLSLFDLAIATVILLVSLFVLRLLSKKMKQVIGGLKFISEGISFRNWEIIHSDSAQNSIDKAITFIHKVVATSFIVIFVLKVLAFFQFTGRFAKAIINLVWTNLQDMMLSFLAYTPKLIFILLTIFITKQVISLFRSFMKQVETGQIRFHMFPKEYAAPTRQILSFAIIVFSLVIISPYLPGSGSQAFKGVTVFLGILVSLGSTTAIANIVASFVIQYMQAFKVGDTVQIGNNTGTILSINLFSTRMNTLSNEYISIPNGLVLTSAMTNYSRKKTTAIEVGISIGYDVPWRDVHTALIAAARTVEGVVSEPEPFVLQRSLDDFYVSYRLFAYIDDARARPMLISRLNESIRDYFEEQGIEILSPHHSELRAHTDVLSVIEKSRE